MRLKSVQIKRFRIFRNITVFLLMMLLVTVQLCSCSKKDYSSDSKMLSIVAVNFPAYDFAREVSGDKADIKLLLKPGSEAHSFEPTPKDIIAIQNSDVFIYTGGESDEWARELLSSIDTSNISIVAMMDCVDTVEEEIVDGMQTGVDTEAEDDDTYEPEYDEHVWTSPVNAAKIAKRISEVISENDLVNKQYYADRTFSYVNKLAELDAEFRNIAENGNRRIIVFGDRFPCRYFADEYGLKYYAAFPGCSSETEASAKTISFLIEKVKNEKIPVVLYPELSNKKVAATICDSTGAECLQFNSCDNITSEDFESGASYLSLMSENISVLKKALN